MIPRVYSLSFLKIIYVLFGSWKFWGKREGKKKKKKIKVDGNKKIEEKFKIYLKSLNYFYMLLQIERNKKVMFLPP